jgi:rhamnosyltransferase
MAAIATEVGVVVITHRAREHLAQCLPPLLGSPLRPRVLVVNSSSSDGTVEEARRLGAETIVVPRDQFNHGLTREHARRAVGTPIVAMLTPDAYPQGTAFLNELTAPIRSGWASATFGRQVARIGAAPLEQLGRRLTYPETSCVVRDLTELRRASFVLSNACAAWSSAALDRIGGFPATLVSEETIAARRLIAAGETIAYIAGAVVRHSHAYGLRDELRRYFDIGWTRAAFPELRGDLAEAARGRRFAARLIDEVAREHPRALARALASLAARWAGYRLGLAGPRLPVALAARLSGQDYYWMASRRGHDAVGTSGTPAACTSRC